MNYGKKNESFVSYQQERLETEICNNLEIFEERSKDILNDLDNIILSDDNSNKLSEFRNDLINHFSYFKNEHFNLIEQIKKFNFENEILIEEYHNQSLKINDIISQNETLESEIKGLKELEKVNFILEENLSNKNKLIDQKSQTIKDLSERINLMKIEIEELNIYNDELKLKLKTFTDRLENQKQNIIKKEKEFHDFRKSIALGNDHLNCYSMRNLFNANPDLDNCEEEITNLNKRKFSTNIQLKQNLIENTSKEEHYSENLEYIKKEIDPYDKNSSSEIEKIHQLNCNTSEECSIKENTKLSEKQNSFLNKFEKRKYEISKSNGNLEKNPFKNAIIETNNNSGNVQNNNSANFVSSGVDDIGQYNTAVSVNSNLNKKTDNPNKKAFLLVDYMKNHLEKNKYVKKPKEKFISINKDLKQNKDNKIKNKKNQTKEPQPPKQIVNLETLLSGFDSDEKRENSNFKPKKLEINSNDNTYTCNNNINNFNSNNPINRNSSSKKIEFCNITNLTKENSNNSMINSLNKFMTNDEKSKNPIKINKIEKIKMIDIYSLKKVNEISIIVDRNSKPLYNSQTQTDNNDFGEKINNDFSEQISTQEFFSKFYSNHDIKNDPLEEFFLLTFQSVKLKFSEFYEILNFINPKILYQEVKYLNTPFHMFNDFILKKFLLDQEI